MPSPEQIRRRIRQKLNEHEQHWAKNNDPEKLKELQELHTALTELGFAVEMKTERCGRIPTQVLQTSYEHTPGRVWVTTIFTDGALVMEQRKDDPESYSVLEGLSGGYGFDTLVGFLSKWCNHDLTRPQPA